MAVWRAFVPLTAFSELTMTMKYSTALMQAQMDAITTAVGNAGKLTIYDGTRPAFNGTATTKLAEWTLSTPFAEPASAARPSVLSPTVPGANGYVAAGAATWYRVTTSGGTTVIDGDVSASSGDLQLNTVTIGSGVSVTVTSWTITSAMA